MPAEIPATALQLRSLVKADQTVELFLDTVEVPEPGPGEVVVLTCMEAAASVAAGSYSRYGSAVHKQVYIYGSLDRGPTELTRNFGMAWGIGGWLLTPFLQKIGPDGMMRLRKRVATELTTTFASSYTDQLSLAGTLQLDAITAYSRHATGSKYLIIPSL